MLSCCEVKNVVGYPQRNKRIERNTWNIGGEFTKGGHGMKKRWIVWMLVLVCLGTMAGCSSKSSDADWNAVCEIHLDNLPEEYNTLPDSIRGQTRVRFSITSPRLDKEYSVELTEENGYKQKIYMVPGSYSIGAVYVRNPALGTLNATTNTNEIVVEKDQVTPVNVSLDQVDSLAETIRRGQPTEEMKEAPLFSRKVQYDGKIVDLNQLRTSIRLDDTDAKYLSSGETLEVTCPGYDGLIAILKNTTSGMIASNEASIVGMRFYKVDAVFPNGIVVGDSLKSIVHAESGRLGTPSYCTGSPLIGMEGCTVVYLDPESGDRLSLEIDGRGEFVTSITYEFEVYQ